MLVVDSNHKKKTCQTTIFIIYVNLRSYILMFVYQWHMERKNVQDTIRAKIMERGADAYDPTAAFQRLESRSELGTRFKLHDEVTIVDERDERNIPSAKPNQPTKIASSRSVQPVLAGESVDGPSLESGEAAVVDLSGVLSPIESKKSTKLLRREQALYLIPPKGTAGKVIFIEPQRPTILGALSAGKVFTAHKESNRLLRATFSKSSIADETNPDEHLEYELNKVDNMSSRMLFAAIKKKNIIPDEKVWLIVLALFPISSTTPS